MHGVWQLQMWTVCGFHIKCGGLKEVPEDGDWHCSDSKNNDDVVKAGESLKETKKKSKTSSQKRDWGKGMATVGRYKVCSMPTNHFGPIPRIEVGSGQSVAVQDAVLRGRGTQTPRGRDPRHGEGRLFLHPDLRRLRGQRGRWRGDLSGNKRTAEKSSDQTLTKVNAAIAKNGKDWKEGKKIRVVRGKSKK